MNKIVMGIAGLVAFGIAAPASAADLSARPYTKAPPMIAAAAYDWSGFYIGGNGGYGTSSKCWDLINNGFGFIPAISEGCHDATGAIAGGQIGYRWQSAAWVFGLEAQGDWANLRGFNQTFPGFNNNTKVEAFGLFTGQIGYAWNNALLYVKGGAAVVSDKYRGTTSVIVGASPIGTVFDNASETRWGGTVGVGAEYGFTPNWSFAVEYDHIFMGNRNVSFTSTGAANNPLGLSRIDVIRQDVDIVTARLNYRFGGPVVAKY